MLQHYLCGVFLLLSSASVYAQKPAPRKATPASVLLQGIWAISKEENAEFWVEGKRLTYVEFQDQPLRYTLTPTKLTIFRSGGPDTYRIRKLTADSLVMVNFTGYVIRLAKRK